MRYRSLFDELLETDDGQVGVAARREPGNVGGQSGADGSALDRPVYGQDAVGAPETVSRRDRGA